MMTIKHYLLWTKMIRTSFIYIFIFVDVLLNWTSER